MKHSRPLFALFFSILSLSQAVAQSSFDLEAARMSMYGHIFVFADNVNLRTRPDLGSTVIATVDEGTALIHITHLSKKDTIGGKVGNWVQVMYRDQNCFVWAPLVSNWAMRSHKDPDYLFLVGPGSGDYTSMIKVFHQGVKQQELSFQGLKSIEGLAETRVEGNHGVELIEELIFLEYHAYSCGQAGGDVIFAWDGEVLRPFFTAWGIGDGGLFEHEKLILPSSPVGEKGVIHVLKESGEYLIHETESTDPYVQNIPRIRMDYQIHQQYLWDGYKLVEMTRKQE